MKWDFSQTTFFFVNWSTITRKSGKYLHTTYRTLDSCFDHIRSHQQHIPWSPPTGATTEYRAKTLPLSYWSTSHTSNAKLISYGNLQWGKSWYMPLIRPNKVKTAVQCSIHHVQVFARFLDHGNSIYNIIPLLKKENVHLFFFFFFVRLFLSCYEQLSSSSCLHLGLSLKMLTSLQ